MKTNKLGLVFLLLTSFALACSFGGGKESATPPAPAKEKPAAATNPPPAPAKETGKADEPTEERIQLAKGKSERDLKVTLAPGQSKKYVAFVAKGYMTCIGPFDSLDPKITIKLNGKVLDVAENGPCSEHAKTAGDQYIEFTNNGNKEVSFTAPVGFYEHG